MEEQKFRSVIVVGEKKVGGMGQGRGWRGRLKTEEKNEEFMREFSVKIFDETQ